MKRDSVYFNYHIIAILPICLTYTYSSGTKQAVDVVMQCGTFVAYKQRGN